MAPHLFAMPVAVTPAAPEPVLVGRVVRVLVDVPALADQGRELDYLVPPSLDADIRVGTMVRVPLHGRRVAGWVLATDVTAPAGVVLQPVTKVTGWGPPPELVDLSAWGAWRWAGRRTALLRSASPLGAVRRLPARPGADAASGRPPAAATAEGDLAREALAVGEAVVRLPPAAEPFGLIQALVAAGPALVVTPSVEAARVLAGRLHRSGTATALVPEGWAQAAAGGVTVVGARAAAWAPAPDATVVVVLDAHDGALVEQRAPSWSAWVVAAERARRRGVPCLLVTPCPLLEQLQWGRLLVPARADERRGWAPIEVIDRSVEDPRLGLLGERLVPVIRSATLSRRVLLILNRKGRVRLLACRVCGKLTVCEHCGTTMEAADDGGLRCRRCHRARPMVCQACGSGALRAVRAGVTKLRDDLQALARLPVAEVTAEIDALPGAPLLVGTAALLHRAADAGVDVGAVVLLDLDMELAAPRYRAGEDALALLARAARLVGGRGPRRPTPDSGQPGRVLVQTRNPGHPVIQAALRGDPGRLADVELPLREELALPPASALAEVSGEPSLTEAYAAAVAAAGGVETLGPTDGRWLIRAPDHRTLCDALAAAGRPAGVGNNQLRIEVDPTGV